MRFHTRLIKEVCICGHSKVLHKSFNNSVPCAVQQCWCFDFYSIYDYIQLRTYKEFMEGKKHDRKKLEQNRRQHSKI